MDPNTFRMSISGDLQTKAAFEEFVAKHANSIAGHRSLQPQNLDGSTAAWVVIATLSAQVIPYFLTFIGEARKNGRVSRLVFGDIEIENPSEEDIRLFRELIRQKLGRDDDHEDATSPG